MNASVWLGTVAGMALAGASWAAAGASAEGERAWSPRAFCLARGGAVTETPDPQVHVCCYAAGQRCVAVNERHRSTVRLRPPADVPAALPAEAPPGRI
ncbi:MAG: hypothetical protein ACOY5W_15690 [Pseudomonadota bacterium]